MTKTREEVEDLKRQWKSCGGDFGLRQEGFEEYAEELRLFEAECEARWKAERREQMEFEMREHGLDPRRDDHVALFGMLMRMKYRLFALEERVTKLERGRDDDNSAYVKENAKLQQTILRHFNGRR